MALEDLNGDLEDDGIPLQHKRPFGSGLRRKQIVFVPASSGNLNSTEQSTSATSSNSVADAYLDLVLPRDSASTTPDIAPPKTCEVCQLPLDETPVDSSQGKSHARRHETSIAHQVCLTHSHPPSALDRRRMGLSVLQSQGWDPDSRSGLGVTQQGMQYPIKVAPKDDKLGIGVKVPKDLEARRKEKVQKLDARKVRNMAVEDKKRREKLQRQFYGNGDLEKYLGSE